MLRRRVLIEQVEGGYRYVMQRRVLRFWWRTTVRSARYGDFADCLLGLSSIWLEAVRGASGLHMTRRARKRAAGKIASRLVAR